MLEVEQIYFAQLKEHQGFLQIEQLCILSNYFQNINVEYLDKSRL